MATLSKSSGNSAGNVQAEQVRVFANRPAEYDDDALVKIVVQDEARAEQFISSQQWALNWREADILYQSPRVSAPFEGTNVTRSNVGRFTVAKHVNSIVPQLISGMFYSDPPFVLRPKRGTSQNVVRAKTEIFSALLAEMDFQNEVELGFEEQTLQGTVIYKWGTEHTTRIEKKFKRKLQPIEVKNPIGPGLKVYPQADDGNEFEVEEVEKHYWRPWIEKVKLENVLVAPGWRHPDIRKAKYVIYNDFLSFNDLNELRQNPDYNIPPEDELKAYFFGPKEPSGNVNELEQESAIGSLVQAQPRNMDESADPLEHTLKVTERCSNDRIVTILRGGDRDGIIIRNHANKFQRLTYLSANWWNVRGSGYGLGVGRIIGQDQRIETGTTNGALDILSMIINQQYVRSRGANVQTQQIRARLGGIIDVDGDAEKALTMLPVPKVDPSLFAVLREAGAQAESATGANEQLVQGSTPERGRTSMGRTATGAANMASATASRLEGPLGHFIKQVFIPFLQILDELVNEEMPQEQIFAILGEAMGDEFLGILAEAESRNGDFLDEFFNSSFSYDVLAGTHLAAKKAMAQSLPLIAQIFENPSLLQQLENAGWIVDVKELFEMFMEVSEWKNTRTLIRKMTPEEQQRVNAVNQAMQKMQAAAALQQQKFQQQQQIEDQKSTNRAGEQVLRQVIEQAATPMAVTGEPGGKGFGANG